MSSPLVSVIIPVYNAEKYIEQTIRSVLNQTFQDFEIIVLNDGSTDSSLSLIKKISLKDPRIVLIDKNNTGACSTKNYGVSIAKGQFIAFLDADDIWENTNLQKKIDLLIGTGKKWVFSNLAYIDENGAQLSILRHHLSVNNLLDRLLLWRAEDVIPGPSSNIIVCRELFYEGIKFDENIFSTEDRDMCIQLAKRFLPAFIDEPLWKYRIHSENRSRSNPRLIKDVAYFIKKTKNQNYFSNNKVKRISLSNLNYMLAGICFQQHKFILTIIYFIKAVVYAPINIWNKKTRPTIK
ncbi:MAG: glycosyltransferase [Bacteroidetes bacterium]|nr:glycosyltransferase [Bacteroidota bacterium]